MAEKKIKNSSNNNKKPRLIVGLTSAGVAGTYKQNECPSLDAGASGVRGSNAGSRGPPLTLPSDSTSFAH